MALFQRIFQQRKQYKNTASKWPSPDSNSQSRPKLDRNKIRLVIYADHDKGRTPMFDSDAIRKVDEDSFERSPQKPGGAKSATNLRPPLGKSNLDGSSSSSQKTCPKYQFKKLSSDNQMLEEMMLGSVGMAYKGLTLKVHFIRSPPQIMLSKIFYPEKPKREPLDLDSDSSSVSSQPLDFSIPKHLSVETQENWDTGYGKSIPVAVPTPSSSYSESTDDESGLNSFTSSGSFQTHFPSPSGNSVSSYNSLHRRWMRTQTTSLQSRKWSSQEQLLSQESSYAQKRRSKLALGILFGYGDDSHDQTNEFFQNFFFSHIPLLEGHVEKLRAVVERGFFNRPRFIPMVMEALELFRNDVYDLYTAPRLAEPVWLNMMSYSNHRYIFCEKFINEFRVLADKFDNKSTKFFLSTLISAVLTHHLAWVATVTPAGGITSRTYLDKHSAKWLDALARTHPYNPLWAQLGDLYGAIGNPLKIARTIVVGKKQDIVKRFLYILSYFIRCSDVHEIRDSGSLETFMNDLTFNDAPLQSEKSSAVTTPIEPGANSGDRFFPSTTSPVCGDRDVCDVGERSRLYQTELGDRCGNQVGERVERTVNRLGGCIEMVSMKDEECNLEGASSSQSDRSEFKCRLSAQRIVECAKVENVQHVRKSADLITNKSLSENVQLSSPDKSSSDSGQNSSLKGTSMLSRQLETVDDSDVKMKVSDVRKMFLSEGSSSMFEEYFEDGIEAKTIDDVAEHERVISHPLASPHALKPSDESGDGARDVGSAKMAATSLQNSPLKISISRQNSRPSSLAPGRCRPVTPTELGKRRHLSSASSIDMDMLDPVLHCQEIIMPEMTSDGAEWNSSVRSYDRNFGRSLLAEFSDHYMSNFVLHGTSDVNLWPKLLSDLQMSSQYSVLDEPIAEAVCVVADTDTWSVDVANSNLLERSPSGRMSWTTSQLVCNLVESVLDLCKLKMSPEFCLMHLEDRLQEIYFKSKMVAEYLKTSKVKNMKDLTSMLGFEASDLPLLLAVAGTHSPSLDL
ncbi:folliculin-interacting protein 1-like isoform X2 [Gigantopelta aegis]|uniref:folliculin-interacting protein 1-like isoform X2 n=1 Tax=Gigantopelta aegis TaxID=1735272 RepID=UPI001B88B793|nr:folliculin-interacting protein 1-like isoform X2 [Gigantopelta aegis]